MPDPTNRLYYGDNLDILRDRDYFPNACVDLIYLDPPFNSARSYNVLFKDESGRQSDAQITAFEDTWHWGETSEALFHDLVTRSTPQLSAAINALRAIVGTNQMMAYLVMMAARLEQLHRVLKPTGSLYLHCDPTASHYLKIILDTIFGADRFINEIIWKRTTAKSDFRQGAKHFPRIHDSILHYAKDIRVSRPYSQPFTSYSDEYVNDKYRSVDENGRRYTLDNLTGPGGAAKGNPQYEFLGVTRYWRFSKQRMEELYQAGRIVQPKPGSVPRYKRYLDEMSGIAIGDIWDDIQPINSQARERLNYPTQKPEALLERIINASSNPGDVVLDPFCGCGTAIAAAQKLDRRWIGIDITHLSVSLMTYRLKDMFDLKKGVDYAVVGEPEDAAGARQLASDDRYQFQWWALSLVGARPLGGEVGSKQGKKGADSGIDGEITFVDGKGKVERVLVQVKSGKVGAQQIRDLVGTVGREKAAIGIFITLDPPTAPMTTEAASAGFFYSALWDTNYPKIQILSVADLMSGKAPRIPSTPGMFKQAERVVKHDQVDTTLPGFE